MIYKEDVERLEEIKNQMRELIEEARGLINMTDKQTKERARAYWIPQITMALDKDHEYMGGCMCTMEDTIEELSQNAVSVIKSSVYEVGQLVTTTDGLVQIDAYLGEQGPNKLPTYRVILDTVKFVNGRPTNVFIMQIVPTPKIIGSEK